MEGSRADGGALPRRARRANPTQHRCCAASAISEIECRDQVDAPVGRTIRERTIIRKPIRRVEKPRSQNTAGVAEVDFVERVTCRNAEAEIVTAIRGGTGHSARPTAEQGTARATAATTTAAAGTAARTATGVADLRTETKCLRESQIHGRVRRTGAVIDGNNFFASRGC